MTAAMMHAIVGEIGRILKSFPVAICEATLEIPRGRCVAFQVMLHGESDAFQRSKQMESSSPRALAYG